MARRGWALATAVGLLAWGCAQGTVVTRGDTIPAIYRAGPVEDVRDAFTVALVRPMADVRWIEATWLDRSLVHREAGEQARLEGRVGEGLEARAKAAVEALATDRAVVEVWLATTCERCLDLRRWGFALRGPNGRVHRPRWVESEVQDRVAQTRRVLDVTRRVTLSWLRGRLVFDPEVLARAGTLTLLASRPEGWDEPVELSWLIALDGS